MRAKKYLATFTILFFFVFIFPFANPNFSNSFVQINSRNNELPGGSGNQDELFSNDAEKAPGSGNGLPPELPLFPPGEGEATPVLDLMVVYTQRALDEAGSIPALPSIDDIITFATEDLNISLTNSQVNLRVNTVYVGLIDFDEVAFISYLNSPG